MTLNFGDVWIDGKIVKLYDISEMSTWFENVITFSDDVLRRRNLAGSKERSELRRFYMFIGPERPGTTLKKSIFKNFGPKASPSAQPRRAAGGHR